MHAALEPLEARPPVLVEGDDLAVEDQLARAHRAAELAQLGIRAVMSRPLRLTKRSAPAVDVRQRPDAVPLDLVGPVRRSPARQLAPSFASIGTSSSGIGSRARPQAGPCGGSSTACRLVWNSTYLPSQPLAVERDHHLVVADFSVS